MIIKGRVDRVPVNRDDIHIMLSKMPPTKGLMKN